MNIKFNDYPVWSLACLDEEALSGNGVLMAIPLYTRPETVDVRKRGRKCMEVVRHVGSTMNPRTSSVLLEAVCQSDFQWRNHCDADNPRSLEMFTVTGVDYSGIDKGRNMFVSVLARGVWSEAKTRMMGIGPEGDRADDIHAAYVRHMLKGLGMPEDRSGAASQELYESVKPLVSMPDGVPAPSSITWEDMLRLMCNVRRSGNRAKLYGILAGSRNKDKPFSLPMPRWTYYSAAPVSKVAVGVASRRELLSWDVGSRKFMQGEDRPAFMRRNPVIEDLACYEWYRIDRVKVMKND